MAELMQIFAGSQGVRAHFTEERHLSILTTPIQTEGELFFSPPSRLARHTRRPGRSSLIVDGDRLTLSDETGEQTLSLDSSAVARGLVDNFILLLRGDLSSLRQMYEVAFYSRGSADSPDSTGWVIELVPRDPTTRSLVERIRITGISDSLSSMDTLETNGDRTIMKFSGVETGIQFDQEQLLLFFSVPKEEESQ
ncbi:MAG: outer membrane lipoprotein carrier protein LolA [Myxococcota bacterium]|nr:outer membrane lipoprotein carrier protein LolA [Myxococcota bacterium]